MSRDINRELNAVLNTFELGALPENPRYVALLERNIHNLKIEAACLEHADDLEKLRDEMCLPTPDEIIALVWVYPDEYFTEYGYVYQWCDEMPFDVWDEDVWDFRHATGRMFWNGDAFEVEYED